MVDSAVPVTTNPLDVQPAMPRPQLSWCLYPDSYLARKVNPFAYSDLWKFSDWKEPTWSIGHTVIVATLNAACL